MASPEQPDQFVVAPGSARREKLTYSVKEFAEAVGIGTGLAYAAVRSGLIPHRRVGRRILIDRVSVRRWLRNRAA